LKAKKLIRKTRLAHKSQRFLELKRKWEFPRFVFKPNNAPPEFVEAVRRATQEIDFRDEGMFPKHEQGVYRRVAQVGAGRAVAELRLMLKHDPLEDVLLTHFFVNLGHQTFLRMPKEILHRFIPFHDVEFLPEGHCIRVCFRSLKMAKGPGGTIYYSKHKPKLEVDGRQLTVGFSGHAINRTCERLARRWPLTYAGLGDVFAFFDQCLEFERCDLHDGTLAFTFFERCAPGFSNYNPVDVILGGKRVPGQDYACRVGYCPAVVEGDFIKAKTMLFPGYGSTPEYGKILSSDLPRERKRAMIEETKQLNARRLLEPEGLTLMKWFHEQGVPQIRAGKVRYAEARDES
jgi:hypothetical protein